jgi:hypothetical protein
MNSKHLLITMLLLALFAPCVVAYTYSDGTTLNLTCHCQLGECKDWNATETIIDNQTFFVCDVSAYTTKPISYNVDEHIIYPQEYYTLGQQSDKIFLDYPDLTTLGKQGSWPSISLPASISAIELRRQTILMERNNELLQEQVNLLKAQKDAKLKCVRPGQMGLCYEYAWVGGA